MKNKLRINVVLGVALLLFIGACKKEDVLPASPDKTVSATENNSTSSNSNSSSSSSSSSSNNQSSGVTTYPNNSGDISFAGISWHVRTNSMLEGPGPNLFSGSG